MTVEIWSDIVCPFCYIGKRKFELALEKFFNKEKVQVEWKSFQLQPEMDFHYDKSVYQLIAEKYNITMEKSKEMHDQLAISAKEVELDYRFDLAKPGNTLYAHQLLHLAKSYGKQHEAEEALFHAYFTEGKSISNQETLVEIGVAIGLEAQAIYRVFESELFVNEIQNDIYESRQVGVRGVPFFVFDQKYTVSGAQEPTVFLTTLERAFAEWIGVKGNSMNALENGDY